MPVRVRLNLQYKHRIIACISSLMAIVMILFLIDLYGESMREEERRMEGTVSSVAVQTSRELDEKLLNIRNYYLQIMEDDEIIWALENEISYSDYSHISSIMELLSGNGIVSDYISGYSFINMDTGWVISNKGMYPYESVINKEDVEELFDYGSDSFGRNYWSWRIEETSVDMLESGWRNTVETGSLALVLKAPNSWRNMYGMVIVNINLQELLGSGREGGWKLAVVDGEGNTVYTTDERFASAGAELYAENGGEQSQAVNTGKYIISGGRSSVLGWICYMGTEWNLAGTTSRFVMLAVSAVLILTICMVVINLLYKPISALAQRVSGDGTEKERSAIWGSELVHIAEKVEGLVDSNRAMEERIGEQENELLELFILRMIRGETSAEEAEEYLGRQKIWTGGGIYSAVSMILRFGEEVEGSDAREQEICMEIAEELPGEIRSMLPVPPVYYQRSVVFFVHGEDQTELLDRVMEVYSSLQKYVLEQYQLNISVGVSAAAGKISEVRNAFRQSVSALNDSDSGEGEGAYGKISACSFYLAEEGGRVIDRRLENEYESGMHAAVLSGDKERAYQVMNDLVRYLKTERMDRGETTMYLLQITNAVIMSAMEAGVSVHSLLTEEISVVYQRIIQFYDYEKIRRYIKKTVIDPVMVSVGAVRETKAYTIMEQIRRLIEERKGDITMAECAEALDYHPTYIWKILKMETDKSFSDYLEEYKIDYAKKLLKETDKTVAEIASELNYTNAQNFIRFFNRVVGMTPGKYRRSIQ
mgnify:FL=1